MLAPIGRELGLDFALSPSQFVPHHSRVFLGPLPFVSFFGHPCLVFVAVQFNVDLFHFSCKRILFPSYHISQTRCSRIKCSSLYDPTQLWSKQNQLGPEKDARCLSWQITKVRNGPSVWSMQFDSTLGFPGEGPTMPSMFSLVTANVSSLNTHHMWKGWDDTVLCLQETRVGRNNVRTTRNNIRANGRGFFAGKLPGILNSQGIQKSSHGGTAILAPEPLTMPFNPAEDCTGLYSKCFESHRVVAAWTQSCPKIRVLVFSLYLKSGATNLADVQRYNEDILADVFTICAQFGDIPCILAGDFQLQPDCYAPVARATNFEGWSDPLNNVDEFGVLSRPVTFSSDGSFPTSLEGCSSLDGCLLNPVATAALIECSLIEGLGTQHKPIRVTLTWSIVKQQGFQLVKNAPLDTTAVPCLDSDDPGCPLHDTAQA